MQLLYLKSLIVELNIIYLMKPNKINKQNKLPVDNI